MLYPDFGLALAHRAKFRIAVAVLNNHPNLTITFFFLAAPISGAFTYLAVKGIALGIFLQLLNSLAELINFLAQVSLSLLFVFSCHFIFSFLYIKFYSANTSCHYFKQRLILA